MKKKLTILLTVIALLLIVLVSAVIVFTKDNNIDKNADGTNETIGENVVTPTTTPEVIPTPIVSENDEPNSEITVTPVVTPEVTSEPTVTVAPTVEITLAPTVTPTVAPEPTITVAPTAIVKPTVAPRPTQKPAVTPKPTVAPKPTNVPTKAPKPSVTPKPTPKPTPVPTKTPGETEIIVDENGDVEVIGTIQDIGVDYNPAKSIERNVDILNDALAPVYGVNWTVEGSLQVPGQITPTPFYLIEDDNRIGIRLYGWRTSYNSSNVLNCYLNAILETFRFLGGDKLGNDLWLFTDDWMINGTANLEDYGFTYKESNDTMVYKNGTAIGYDETDDYFTYWFYFN